MDNRLALMCGTDIPIPECQLIIHQPTIKEIALIGEIDFFTAIQCLCIDKNYLLTQDKNVPTDINNFQIFMMIISEKETASKKESIMLLLTLLFPKYKIIFTPRAIILSEEDRQVMIDQNNFEIFQNYLKLIFCHDKMYGGKDTNYNPANKKAEEIARKIMKGRQKVASLKGEENISIFSQYLSILTVGLNSMSLKDCMDLTLFQFYDLIERYQLYIAWDVDLRARLAGAKPDSSPDNWMKNIH